jgi:hypothetical protein
MSNDTKIRIDIGRGHIDVINFIGLEDLSLLQLLINFHLKHHISLLFVLKSVHKFTLQCKLPLLIKTFCLDTSGKVR